MNHRKIYYRIRGKLFWSTVYGELDKPINMLGNLKAKGVRALVLVNPTKATEY